jgi:RHS repeat-associated protein
MGNWLGFQNDALNQTRQFNKVNEITSINGPSGVVTPLYDPVGNMTSMPAVSNWTTAQTLKWDAWNRLVRVSEGSITIAEYSYDAIFRRVTKAVSGTTRRFYYSDQWQILEEYLGSSANPHMRYWYGLRDINDIARRQRYSSGTTLQDDLYALRETMNVVGLADISGAVQQRMAYDAFGAVRFLNVAFGSGANSADWAVLFHAHYRDAETGLCQIRFRCYHPHLGVWLGRDPIGERGGVNQLASMGNDAINSTDQLGLSPTVKKCSDPGSAIRKKGPCSGKMTERDITLSTVDALPRSTNALFAAADKLGSNDWQYKTFSELSHIITWLESEIGPCECVRQFTLLAHGSNAEPVARGGDGTRGGICVSNSLTEQMWLIGEEGGRILGRILQKMMCRPCTIDLFVCYAALNSGRLMRGLSSESGCTVRAANKLIMPGDPLHPDFAWTLPGKGWWEMVPGGKPAPNPALPLRGIGRLPK